MDEVTTGLFVGDETYSNASCFDVYVNLTHDVRNPQLSPNQRAFCYDVYGSHETDQVAMLTALNLICKPIVETLNRGGWVLVFCNEGKQRSCTVVAACLMLMFAITCENASTRVLAKHKQAWDYGVYQHYANALFRFGLDIS